MCATFSGVPRDIDQGVETCASADHGVYEVCTVFSNGGCLVMCSTTDRDLASVIPDKKEKRASKTEGSKNENANVYYPGHNTNKQMLFFEAVIANS